MGTCGVARGIPRPFKRPRVWRMEASLCTEGVPILHFAAACMYICMCVQAVSLYCLQHLHCQAHAARLHYSHCASPTTLLLHRRDDKRTVTVRGHALDNRWVVPHNLFIAARYDAHINVEVVGSTGCVQYLFKYLHKGHDRADMETMASPAFAAFALLCIAFALLCFALLPLFCFVF